MRVTRLERFRSTREEALPKCHAVVLMCVKITNASFYASRAILINGTARLQIENEQDWTHSEADRACVCSIGHKRAEGTQSEQSLQFCVVHCCPLRRQQHGECVFCKPCICFRNCEYPKNYIARLQRCMVITLSVVEIS